MIDLKELYWVAGFLEGEGCFTSVRGQPIVHACQKQKEPLERLQKFFGHGNIGDGSKRSYQWRLNGKRAAAAMMTLYVLMSPRRQEWIREALTNWRALPRRGHYIRDGGSRVLVL